MTEYMNVPVPTDRLQDVYELLARVPEPAAAVSLTEDQDPRLPAGWSAFDIVRAYRESPDTMKTVLAHLSERPGVAVSGGELAGLIPYTRPQFAGTLGAFGRRIKNRYSKTTWPIEAEANSADDEWHYRMSQGVAELIVAEMEGRTPDA
jgi:hypothetical protein